MRFRRENDNLSFLVETGQGSADSFAIVGYMNSPNNPGKAFKSNDYFSMKLTEDQKKATKIIEISFFKIEDLKTASKKEYGYIMTLDTNGMIWETYVQSQGSTYTGRSGLFRVIKLKISRTGKIVIGSRIASMLILIVALLKLKLLILESRLKPLQPVPGTQKNLLTDFQVRVKNSIEDEILECSSESILNLKSRWNVWPVLVGECLHEIQGDGR